ncbi:hypothetical protein [Clostridium senegalense]|uniref:Uncharacterized protein n=1 Tax=Clostridium senegalense TaxID=1465809 RepID=A0A6M0H5I4_9CLOT|nr:hypothetical protein [Clostridium senegalense]NEU05514.1 hypothetical protein [Clostridium senegalense]
MKKKLFIIISVAIILIYLFYPDTIVSKIDLEKLSQTGNLKLEFIHRNNILEGGDVTVISNKSDINKFIDLISNYKCIRDVVFTKNLHKVETYNINFRINDKIVGSMCFSESYVYLNIEDSIIKRKRYIMLDYIDFKSLNEFVESLK